MEVPKIFLSKGDKTFQYQDTLPSLPRPNLDKTLDKYLESVRAVTTDDEYKQTEIHVTAFRAILGPWLQEKLLKKTENQRNWLEKMWEQKAYLEGRYPSAPLVNIAGIGPYYFSVWPPKAGTQIERAGLLLHSTIMFWKLLREEKLAVDPAGRTGHSCMNQYRRLFNTCKRPGIKEDNLNFFFKTEAEGPCPNHVTIICKGRFFSLDVLDPSGDILTPPELEVQLRHIREKCDQEAAAPGLGSLTGDERMRWAQNREHLLNSHPSHPKLISEIETSILSFVLDDASPEDPHEVMRHGLAGNSANRWFDKSVNQVMFSNGTVASNCDHAPFDGLVYIFATYFATLVLDKCGGVWHGSKEVRDMPPPKELEFHYDATICSAITTARAKYDSLANNIEVYYLVYKGYGKKFMRSFKLHPDAYCQLAAQLAYYRMYKKPAPTYETGTVRAYYNGRTETVRSCTVEALKWCQAMCDPHSTPREKLVLFKAAIQKHIKNMTEAMQLQGCDRHLLALSVIAEEEGIETPRIYKDPAFKKSGGGGNFILSTSFVGYTPVTGGCAAMCEHGYGVFYSIQQEQVSYYITTWASDDDTDAKQMFASLSMTFNDMRSLLEQAAPPAKHKL